MPTIPSTAGIDSATWAAGQSIQQATANRPVNTAKAAAGSVSGQPDDHAKAVGQQFEAMYLRQMLDEFMPKDSEELFGKGTSGTVWRSMLVDSLATTLSKTGTMGLAQMVIRPNTTGPEGK
jgi:Rod binding domain-containing protein